MTDQELNKKRKSLPKEYQLYPERKKGCLSMNPGKGDADSRCTSHVNRRKRLADIFGEKCPHCRANSKERMSDGQYWCNTCNKRFTAI